MGEWRESGADRADSGYRVQTDYHDETPSFALLRVLSVLMNCEMRNFSPLNEQFNLGALDRLLTTAYETSQEVTVEVEIEDYTAVVRDDGTITVHEDGSVDEDVES